MLYAIPVEQVTPVQPESQLQKKAFTWSVQLPYRQGLLSHSSISVTNILILERKPNLTLTIKNDQAYFILVFNN